MMQKVYGHECSSRPTICEWLKQCKGDREDLHVAMKGKPYADIENIQKSTTAIPNIR